MALPPEDVGASELFLKLIDGPAPHIEVEFPRRGIGRVIVQVLPLEKHNEARIRAQKRLKKELAEAAAQAGGAGSQLSDEVLGDHTACELIALAYYEAKEFAPGRRRRIFATGEDVSRLTADEVQALFAAYIEAQRRFGPHEETFQSDDEVNAWIKRLEEGGSALPLFQLASHQLGDLCKLLASRALALSELIRCQRESLPISWESIPESWLIGTGSSGAPAAEFTPSRPSEPITVEDAMRVAKLIRGS